MLWVPEVTLRKLGAVVSSLSAGGSERRPARVRKVMRCLVVYAGGCDLYVGKL